MIRGLLSLYSLQYPSALVYMLQNTEYQAWPYLAWFWRTTNFSRVTYRRALDRTKAARMLLAVLRGGMLAQIVLGLVLLALWYWHGLAGGWQFGLALLLSYPLVWAHLIVVPLVLGRILIVRPRERRLIRQAERIFRKHQGIKIAIVGSYGKTSMKELLVTVLGQNKRIAATPANLNVAISQARFAYTLKGDEEIVIIEFGEARPGDTMRFTWLTHPNRAIITGVAPAHLDRYKTVQAVGRDLFSIVQSRRVKANKTYINADSPLAKPFINPKLYHTYSSRGALGWTVSDGAVDLEGVSFTLHKDGRSLKLASRLLGRHQIGPLALAAALAAEFGLSNQQIEAGIARTAPYEHRMQPYQLAGAWIIDDTYNGNIEGVRAGAALLKELPAKRKIYITPGLVDQGEEVDTVHHQIGMIIASAKPDIVVLMQNSVTEFIQAGLISAGYEGEVMIETDPLTFYTNLNLFVAAGDVVLMQNDWPDNYR